MCGHLDQRLEAIKAFAAIMAELQVRGMRGRVTTPAHPIGLLTDRGLMVGTWGWRLGPDLRPHARRERLADSVLWAPSRENRRCAVPCLAWWEGSWRFRARDVLWLAGLWREEPVLRHDEGGPRRGPVVAIITADGGDRWALQSDRHPIPLTYEQAETWCRTGDEGATLDAPRMDVVCDGVGPTGTEQQTLFS